MPACDGGAYGYRTRALSAVPHMRVAPCNHVPSGGRIVRSVSSLNGKEGEPMVLRRSAVWVYGVVMSLVAAAHGAVPGFVEDFNDGTTGTFFSQADLTPIPSGGVGGTGDGFLQISRDVPDFLGAATSSPNFTGDLLADGVTGFSFWLNDVGASQDFEIHVGVGQAQSNFWLSIDGFTPPENGWAEFSVDITDPSGWVQTQGAGTFEDAIAASNRLLFRHDLPPLIFFPDAIAGDLGLDRVTVLPEPGSLSLLIIGGAIALRSRRRGLRR